MLKGSKCRGDIKHQRSYSRLNFRVIKMPYRISNAEAGIMHNLRKYPTWFCSWLNLETGDHARRCWPIQIKSSTSIIDAIPEKTREFRGHGF